METQAVQTQLLLMRVPWLWECGMVRKVLDETDPALVARYAGAIAKWDEAVESGSEENTFSAWCDYDEAEQSLVRDVAKRLTPHVGNRSYTRGSQERWVRDRLRWVAFASPTHRPFAVERCVEEEAVP